MNLTQLLGIEVPIIQAPMASSQGSPLAIAVSNSGGLGSLPCATLSLDALRAELDAIQHGTRGPYNVNFFCHTPPPVDEQREAAWRRLLAPYYDEFGIDPNSIVAAPARAPFSEAAADVLAEFKPPVVSFHFGLPAAELVARVKAWGAKVLSSATTVAEARWLAERGVDAIIAQGVEAGGHRGMFLSTDLGTQLDTASLVRAIVQEVPLPVIAAGGIATGEDVRAAMKNGASGVQAGTAFLLCPEAATASVHRAAIQSASARETALTNLFTGRPARGIVNRLMNDLGPLHAFTPPFPLAAAALAPLRAAAEKLGRGDFSPLWAGVHANLCQPISAAEVLSQLAAGLGTKTTPATQLRKVRVVPNDPRWSHEFERAAAELAAVLGANLVAIHHIGSTAVPGIHAKPIIDLLPVVRDLSAVDARTPALEKLGYEALGELGIAGRRYLRRCDAAGQRTHHVHVFEQHSPHITRHLAFRDFLRAHPEQAQHYSALKQRLAAAHPDDWNAYCDEKDAFVQPLERQAMAWFAEQGS